MSRAKTIIGALAVCALAVAAVGAANASAAGLTSVVCVNDGPGSEFATSHCETPATGGEFETVSYEGLVKSTSASPQLTAVLALTKVVVECDTSTGTGEVTNKVEGGEMRAHGTGLHIDYTGCEARLGKKTRTTEACEVEDFATSTGGTILTNELTTLSGAEHKVTVEPAAAGGAFVKFRILAAGKTGLSCSIPAVTVTVTGKLTGIASESIHSHLTFTEATNGTELKANGATTHYIGTGVGYKDEEGTEGPTVGLTTE